MNLETRIPTLRALAMAGGLFCTALFADSLAAQQLTTVLRGATIHTGNGKIIPKGTVILVAGKIDRVGDANLTAPEGARVVDASGKVITPGLVDAGTSLSVSRTHANEQGAEVTPHMQILDAVDPAHEVFEKVRRNGVTTVQINPGNRNAIGGLGAVLKTYGRDVRNMLVKGDSGLRVTMGAEPYRGNRAPRFGAPTGIYYRRPTTRMGVVWAVRKAFYDAKAYQEQKSVGEDTPPDPGMEVLLQALKGKLMVHTTARAEQDIRTALRLAEEFGYQTVVEGGIEAYRVVDLLASTKSKLIFAPPSLNGRGNIDGAEGRYHTLTLLAKAGVPFAIQTDSSLGERKLADEAMVAMRNGLSLKQALAAVTLVPAQILGIADRVGSLEAGKDADLVVWSGTPFHPTTVAERVFVTGKEVVKP